MKQIQEILKRVRDALNSTSAKGSVYHFTRPQGQPPRYVVWQEEGEVFSSHSDNRRVNQQIYGSIDCFTQNEFDPLIDEIQEALNNLDSVGWSLSSVQYEDSTNYIHYEWAFRAG